ncbi:MAG: toxin-antitoxin system HicB family antitoxin [Acidimicrobiia bacterium]|nr:toxin-antitoxin system HicB family antitoxin [Acidimicrobiia bacterium]
MSTLTIRMPESKHERLRRLAESRGISMNKLIDELATVALAQHDAETRFRALASKGSARRGLELLEKLKKGFRRGGGV